MLDSTVPFLAGVIRGGVGGVFLFLGFYRDTQNTESLVIFLSPPANGVAVSYIML